MGCHPCNNNNNAIDESNCTHSHVHVLTHPVSPHEAQLHDELTMHGLAYNILAISYILACNYVSIIWECSLSLKVCGNMQMRTFIMKVSCIHMSNSQRER